MSHKKPKNKKKEQKKIAQKIKSLNKKKEVYLSIIKTLGLEEEFKLLSPSVKEDLYNFSWPQIQVCTKEIKDAVLGNRIKDLIFQAFEFETIRVDSTEISLSSYCNLIGLYVFIISCYEDAMRHKGSIAKKYLDKYAAFIDPLNKLNSKLQPIVEGTYQKYSSSVVNTATKIVIGFYNFDDGIYPKFINHFTESKKPCTTIQLCKINIKKETVELDGSKRSVYHCPYYNGDSVEPIFFEKDIIGNKERLPVYVQDHALERLLERINIKVPGYLFDCLGRSLANPINSGRDYSSYLIDFNLYSYKIGYLVVSKFENFALVRTFKFITMTGTPEFNKITKILKTTRDDVSYLGLDTLDILVNSDLSKDAKLKEIFSKCGLDHLFKLGELLESSFSIFANPKSSVAEEIKKYFKIKDKN